jgi:hypothetical protein
VGLASRRQLRSALGRLSGVTSPAVRARARSPLSFAIVGIVLLVLLAGILGHLGDGAPSATAAAPLGPAPAVGHDADVTATTGLPSYVVPAPPPIERRAQLPGGGYRIFGDHRFLVAYYGTAQTGAMGVLGASDPATMQRRLMRAARPFKEPGEHIQPVYELIVTVADRSPGPDHVFSHDIPRDLVEGYVRAAHRNGALLLLDIQTGRARFPVVAKRWTWALKKPWVGLALDPEWRMGPHQVPATVVGSVRAAEVNRTSAWLSRLVTRNSLPEKLFVLHQFRLSMLPDIGKVVHRPGLAMVQHTDGFGTRGQKLATYHAVARPHQFRQGFKLFYHWDIHRFTPRQVRRFHPRVSFVSYQ